MEFTNEQLLNIVSNFSKYKGEYNVKYFNYRYNAAMYKAKFKEYVFKMQNEVINKITKGEKTDDLLAKFFVLKNINGNEVVNYTDKLCELYSITKDELNKLGNIYNHPANYYSVNNDSYVIKYDNLEKDGITVTNKPVIIPNEIKEEEPSNKSIFDEEQIPEEIENVEPVQKNYITLTTNDLNSTIKEYNTYFDELKNDSTKDISSEDLLKEANNKINSGKIGLSSENDYKLLAKAILYLRANNNGILKGTFSKAFNIGPRQLDELVQVVRANSHLDKIYDDITIDGDGHYSNHSLKEKNEKVKEYIDKNKYNQDLLGKNPLNMDKSDIFAIYSDVCSLDDSDLTTLKSVYSASRDYMQNKSFQMRYPSKFNAKIKGLASIVSMNLKNRFDLNKNSDLLEVLGINKKQLESLSKVIDYFKNNSVENIGDISISNDGNIVCDDKLLSDINNFTLNRKNILEERLNIKQQENKEVEEKVSTVSNEENIIENNKEEVKVESTSALNNKNVINENAKEKNIMNLSLEQISKLAQEDKKLKDSFTLDLENNNPSQKTITFKTLIKDFKNKLEKDSKENKTIENYIDLFAKYSFYKSINNRDTAEDLEDLLKEHFNLKKEDLEELTNIYEKCENLVPVIEENKIEEEKEVIVEENEVVEKNEVVEENEVTDNGEANKEEQKIENDVTESSNDIQSNNDNEIEIEENYPLPVVLNRDWFYRKNFKDIFKAFNNLNGYNVDDIVRVIKEQEKTIAQPSDAQYINKGNGSLLLAAAFKLRDLGENKILKDLETFLTYNCGIDDERLNIFYKIKDEYANKKIDKKIVLNNNNNLGIDNDQVDEKEDYIDTELIEEDQFSKYRAHNNTEFQKVNFLITDLINNTTNHKYNVADFDEVYEKISNEIKDKVKNKSDTFDRTVSGLSAGYRMIAFYFALTALKNEAQKTLTGKESIIKEIDHAKKLVSGDMDYLISKTENFIKNPYFIGFPTGNFNLLKSSFKNNQLPDRNDIKRVLDNTEPNKYIEYNVNETKLRYRFDSDFTLLLNTEHIKAMSNYYNEYLDLNLNHEELEKKFNNLMENLNYPTFKNGAFNSLNDASLKALPMLIILSKYRIDSWVKEQYNKFEKVGLSSEQLETAITLIKGFRKFRFPNNDKFIEVNSSGKIYSNLDDDGVYFRQIDFTGNYIKHDSEVSEHEDIARDIKSFEQVSKEDKANIEEEMAMEYQNSIEEFRDKTHSSKENPKGLITGPEKLSKALSILAIHKGVYNEMFKEKNIFQKIGTWFSKKARNCRAEIKEMNNFFKNNNIDPNEYIDMSNKETFTNDNKVKGFFKNYAEENKDALSKFGILENKKENTQKVQSLNIDWNKYVSNEQESMEIKVNTSIKEINSLENDNYRSK